MFIPSIAGDSASSSSGIWAEPASSATRRYLPFLGLIVGVIGPRLPTINFDVLNVDEARGHTRDPVSAKAVAVRSALQAQQDSSLRADLRDLENLPKVEAGEPDDEDMGSLWSF